MTERLRILFTMPVPFVRELGVSRGPFDLASELRVRGHHVESFDWVDACGGPVYSRMQRLRPRRFSRRARAYVRAHGHLFDVIDANQGDLPFSKRELRFEGLLVARSAGLFSVYEDYVRFERAQWPERRRGTVVGRMLHRWSRWRQLDAARRSLEHADLIILPNDEEAASVRDVLGLGERCLVVPLGLRECDAERFASAALPSADRLASRTVSVVGSWSLRKGAADWPEIIARTRERLPGVSFRFLGTGSSSEQVLSDIGTADNITVVPHFQAEELPDLLAGSTVGALPTYAEAWGFAVLEHLAARLPVVAYDAPGPRAMLCPLESGLLVSIGDANAFAERLAALLMLGEQEYALLAERCEAAAARYRWSVLAGLTLDAYRERCTSTART